MPDFMEDMRERVGEMSRVGLSAAKIAEELGCSTRTVVRWRAVLRAEAGEPPMPSATQGLPSRLSEAERLIAAGAPHDEVVRTLHIHQRTLRNHFPGTTWSAVEAGRYARMVEKFNRIDPRNVLRDVS